VLSLVLVAITFSVAWANADGVVNALAQNKHIGCWIWTSWGEGEPSRDDWLSFDQVCFDTAHKGFRKSISIDPVAEWFQYSTKQDEIAVHDGETFRILDIDDTKLEVEGRLGIRTYRLLCRARHDDKACEGFGLLDRK